MSDRSGLVKKQVQVIRNGKTFTQTKWVKPGQDTTKDFILVGSRIKLVGSNEAGKIVGVDKERNFWIITLDGNPVKLYIRKEKVEIIPLKNDNQISETIQHVTPETRPQAGLLLAGGTLSETIDVGTNFQPIITDIQFSNEKKSILKGLDYSTFPPKDIVLPTLKNVVEKPRPSYIPEIDVSFYGPKRLPPFIKLEDGNYALVTQQNMDKGLVKVSPEILTAAFQYHSLLKQAEYQKNIPSRVEQIKVRYGVPEESALKAVKQDRPKNWVIRENKTTKTQMQYLLALTPTTELTKWKDYSAMVKELNVVSNDMEVVAELEDNNYYKGRETAYGNKGTKADLIDKYGVLVKRQNGSEITEEQVNQIDNALGAIAKVIGPTKELAKSVGLKISHSGQKLMHARNAAGMYLPGMNAIGVSTRAGNIDFGFTLAHELSHFIDHKLGEQKFNHRYASHNRKTIAGQIAETFRDNLKQKSTSGYINASHECFARALEQYFGTKTEGADAFELLSNSNGIYATEEKFKEKVQPLIEQFLSEHKSFIKSLPIQIRTLSNNK